MAVPRISFVFCSVLVMLGVALSNSYSLMIAACIFTLLGYLYFIYRLLEQRQAYRFFLAAALFVSVWNIMGFLQGSYFLSSLDIQDMSEAFSVLSLTLDVTMQDYAAAFAYLFSFVLVCCLISEYQPLRNAEYRYVGMLLRVFQDTTFLSWAFLLLTLSVFFLVLTFGGIFRARGIGDEFTPDIGQLQWWYPIVLFLITILPLLISRCSAYIRSIFSQETYITCFGFLVALYINALSARRYLVYFIASLIYYFFFFVRPSQFSRALNAKKRIIIFILLLVLLPLLYLLLTFFQYIRWQEDLVLNPFEFVALFIDFLGSDQLDATTESAQQNLSFRPFVLYPVAAAIKMYLANMNQGFGYFQDIRDSFLNSLPRAIVWDKSQLLFAQNAVLAFFPFREGDLADSPMFDSFGAFGFFGIIIYPLYMAFCYCMHLVLVAFLARGPGSLVAFIISFSTLGRFAVSSYAEGSTGNIFNRELIIVPLLLILINKLFVYPYELSLRKKSKLPY